jgi:hypothetical protein
MRTLDEQLPRQELNCGAGQEVTGDEPRLCQFQEHPSGDGKVQRSDVNTVAPSRRRSGAPA